MNKCLPKEFNDLYNLLNDIYLFENILIVNTPTTGPFLDKMCLDKKTIRIKYNFDDLNNFITTINSISEKFDLILVDPYHEYKHSITTFKMLTPLLNENGILISHDCYPEKFSITSPVYVKGIWCGVTYAAFIENSYDNPDFYYAVINNDYGLGIMSKVEIPFVKKIFDKEKQKIFLDLFKEDDYEKAYDYFKKYPNDIINLISN
jgi:hypothetical protein